MTIYVNSFEIYVTILEGVVGQTEAFIRYFQLFMRALIREFKRRRSLDGF